MNEEQERLINLVLSQIQNCSSLEQLEQLRIDLLGRQGLITQQFAQIKQMPLKECTEVGKKINLLKVKTLELLSQKKLYLEQEELSAEIERNWCDLTIAGKPRAIGRIHPISQAKKELLSTLSTFGFIEMSGPEVEDEWHNFTALNMPKEHPARQMFDTFYLETKLNNSSQSPKLLRTHTSNVQIRVMHNQRPPFRFMSAGRVYRKDSDATHTPMFHQIEGVLVGRHYTFANMKFLLTELIKRFFGSNVEMRMRPSFFPFTSPSAEIDIKMPNDNKWLEVMGMGMIHPEVFVNCNIEKDWQGFAFGLGVERCAMIKYNILDLRHMFESDVRWLHQHGFGTFGNQIS